MITLKPYGNIRSNRNDKHSVYDLIRVIGGRTQPRQAWERFKEKYPDIEKECQNYKFSKEASGTPVADYQCCLLIIKMLPDVVGDSYRAEAAKLFLHEECRVI